MALSWFGKTVRFLLFLVVLYLVLHYGRPLLVPLTFALVISMLLLPLSVKLEGWGLPRWASILLSVLTLLLFFAGVVWLISWQLSDLAAQSAELEKNLQQKVQQFRQFLSRSVGVSTQQQDKVVESASGSGSGGSGMSTVITGFLGGLGTFVTNFILVLVYTFLILLYRSHLKKFVLRVVPDGKERKTADILDEAAGVARKYLTGLALMILCLWVLYGIGFSIVGVRNALFFAVLCGLLEIVPFVGNITGTLLTILVSLAQGGNSGVLIGILVTYGLVQFFQTYILEPLIVGRGVSINPLATIVGIVAGEFIWGIPGMILAIPLVGIFKIVCDHVEPLKPYGQLLGEDKKR